MVEEIATPGTRVAHATQNTGGSGTYSERQYVYASITGDPVIQEDGTAVVKPAGNIATIPERGQSVMARVQKVNTGDKVDCQILMVEGRMLQSPFKAQIKLHDIREFETDNLDILDCFRPGDVIKAHVISLGDSRNVFLSTCGEGYGVIMATSMHGGTLSPISFELMQCQKTGDKEFRKVAKPTNLAQN